MNSLYDSIPFENKDGGVWKQGFNISYNPSDWDNQKLEVIILPHSHQDTGWFRTNYVLMYFQFLFGYLFLILKGVNLWGFDFRETFISP